jgi:hypothetical protein
MRLEAEIVLSTLFGSRMLMKINNISPKIKNIFKIAILPRKKAILPLQ